MMLFLDLLQIGINYKYFFTTKCCVSFLGLLAKHSRFNSVIMFCIKNQGGSVETDPP